MQEAMGATDGPVQAPAHVHGQKPCSGTASATWSAMGTHAAQPQPQGVAQEAAASTPATSMEVDMGSAKPHATAHGSTQPQRQAHSQCMSQTSAQEQGPNPKRVAGPTQSSNSSAELAADQAGSEHHSAAQSKAQHTAQQQSTAQGQGEAQGTARPAVVVVVVSPKGVKRARATDADEVSMELGHILNSTLNTL